MEKFLFLAGLIFLLILPKAASAFDCYESKIMTPTPFMGNNNEIFRLADSSVWEVKFAYNYMYSYYPQVIICPSQRKLIIGTKQLNIEPLAPPTNAINNSGAVRWNTW